MMTHFGDTISILILRVRPLKPSIYYTKKIMGEPTGTLSCIWVVVRKSPL